MQAVAGVNGLQRHVGQFAPLRSGGRAQQLKRCCAGQSVLHHGDAGGDIDAAVATTKAKGGFILQEPIEIPGGDFSMVGMDPQGAPFALVGART